jgi:hypothetical protein
MLSSFFSSFATNGMRFVLFKTKYKLILCLWLALTINGASIFTVQSQTLIKFSESPYRLRTKGFGLGASLHTQGFGLDIIQWRLIGKKDELFFLYQASSLTDTREQVVRNDNLYEGAKNFVFDKKNYCYTLSAVCGIQRIANPLDSFSQFSIRLGVGVGPILAFLKPYYIDYFLPNPGNPNFGSAVPRPYNHKEMEFTDIIGASDFFKGFDKLAIIPGIRALPHVIFNFAGSNLYIRAVQVGMQFDAYFTPVEILDQSQDHFFFLQGSIGFLIGNGW